MRNYLENCGTRHRWLFLGVGASLALVGGIFTATIVGAFIGIPMLPLALPLLKRPGLQISCA
jgi:hypothetical protein